MTSSIASTDGILFDLDGVLVDSRVAYARSVNAALSAHGVAVRDEEDLAQFIGPPLHMSFATMLGERASEPGLIESCVEAYRERYRERSVEETLVVPGIVELLERLGQRFPLVVATSKTQALAEPLLEGLGLRRHFAAVTGPSLSFRTEDKSATVGRALQTLPGARRPLMIGDRRFDVAAAAAHGIDCVGVLWGIGSEEELRTAGAAAIVGQPRELEEMLAA